MSGGIAYILDRDRDFERRCNMETIGLEQLEDAADILELRSLLERHLQYTGSKVASALLDDWDASLALFVKVMPIDYKRVLMANNAQKARIVASA